MDVIQIIATFDTTTPGREGADHSIIAYKNIMNTAFITCLIAGYQWIIILIVVLLLFGGKKIPELMRGVGKGVRAFKEGMNEVEDNLTEEPAKKSAVKAPAKKTVKKKATKKAEE